MKQLTIIFFLFLNYLISSQNLVPNPSFETYNKCPWSIGTFSNNVKHWSIPNLGTTDFFSTCSKRIGVNNYNGNQVPKDGQTYAGFYLFSPNNYREYIQVELSKKLEANKLYRIKFYISLAEKSTEALNNISVLFTENKLGFKRREVNSNTSILTSKKNDYTKYQHISETYIKPKKYTKGAFQLYNIKSSDFYKNREEWMEVSYEFAASGYETYFTIGNFQSNKKTETLEVLKTTKSKHQFSYYYIDDVSIESLENEETFKEIESTLEEPEIKTNKIYTFKNVLFDFDMSDLLDVSITELNELYKYLNKNQKLTIEIYGHTDNVGLDERNKELSKQRAKAVADYLISQGLDVSRIQYIGFGSSKPVSDNDTDEGRQQNRRVEFKLTEN